MRPTCHPSVVPVIENTVSSVAGKNATCAITPSSGSLGRGSRRISNQPAPSFKINFATLVSFSSVRRAVGKAAGNGAGTAWSERNTRSLTMTEHRAAEAGGNKGDEGQGAVTRPPAFPNRTYGFPVYGS